MAKKPPQKPKPERRGRPIQVYLDDDLRAEFDAFVESLRPRQSVSSVVRDAIVLLMDTSKQEDNK